MEYPSFVGPVRMDRYVRNAVDFEHEVDKMYEKEDYRIVVDKKKNAVDNNEYVMDNKKHVVDDEKNAVDDDEIAVVNNLYENGKNIKSCLLAGELENSLEGILKKQIKHMTNALHKMNESKEGDLELKDCPFPRTGGNAEAWAEDVKFYVQQNIDKFAAPLLYLKFTEAVRKTES